jgi:peptidoglycan/xylan/chitin deacetylase (PgdA/CDA1 family)
MNKHTVQKIIRDVNLLLFQKQLPDQIVVYFHEIKNDEINAINDIILFFKNIDYEFVSVSEISNNFNTTKKLFSFTFDDGFKNWENVIPIFELHDVIGTFFLNSVFLTDEGNSIFLKNISLKDESEIISKKIISELVNHNHEIGAHTHNHYKLSNLKFDEFKTEIDTNLLLLSEFSSQINSFAIPYGMRRYTKREQVDYLKDKFSSVCFGEAGMLFNQSKTSIQRYPWQVNATFYQNLKNICTDTQIFNGLTKRSGLG